MITMFKEDNKRDLLSQAYKKAFDYLHYPEDERGREERKNTDVRLVVSDIMMSNLKGRTNILHKARVTPTKEKLLDDKPFLRFPGYPKKILRLSNDVPKFMIAMGQEQNKLVWLNKQYDRSRMTGEMYLDMVSVLNKDKITISDIRLIL